jgi:hypothetical protein
MQCLEHAVILWGLLESVIPNTNACDVLCKFLHSLTQLRQHQPFIFESHHDQLERVVDLTWEQLLFCLPSINSMELDPALRILMQTEGLARDFGKVNSNWHETWVARLEWMLKYGELGVGITYACRLLKIKANKDSINFDTDLELLMMDMKQLLNLHHENGYIALYTLIRLDPKLLDRKQKGGLLLMLNSLIRSWDESSFIDSLPQLRLLFSAFDPIAIEELSERVGQLNGWIELPELFSADIDEAQIMQAQSAHKKVLLQLEERGLSHWMMN